MVANEQRELNSFNGYLRQLNYICLENAPTHFDALGQPIPYYKYCVYTRTVKPQDVKLICFGNSFEELHRAIDRMRQIEQNVAAAMAVNALCAGISQKPKPKPARRRFG